MRLSEIRISYHRNGIAGCGFYAILFDGPDGRMVAAVFPEPGHIAVLKMDRLVNDDISLGSNHWRGDEFEDELRKAIAKHEAELSAELSH